MNHALILAGGTGSRMNTLTIPKQYLLVNEKPVITYCLTTFNKNANIDTITIVADDYWYDFNKKWITQTNITKFKAFAKPGSTRQHSIYNGLLTIKDFADPDDTVIIHDAARPFVSDLIINSCIEATEEADGALPVIPVKDTIYKSSTGTTVTGLLNRDELYAGQAPESFLFQKYLAIHEHLSITEINQIKGSSELAIKYGMNIKLVKGDERNYKLTTLEDLHNFENDISKGVNANESLCITRN